MGSKRDHEGYLFIDSRNGPISEEVLRWAGLPENAGRGIFETATYTCSHCQVVVYLNPKRNRERAWCKKCDHYICDACGALYGMNYECVPYRKRLDDALEAAAKQSEPTANPVILLHNV